MRNLIFIIISLYCSISNAQNTQWNEFKTKNFSIFSIDNNQGIYLQDNIENIKTWCLKRWNLPDINFQATIYCVPDEQLLKKLGFYTSSIRVTEGKHGKEYTMWLLYNNNPTICIPPPLTYLCMKKLENDNFIKPEFWVYRGISALNCSVPEIRHRIYQLKILLAEDQMMFFSYSLFNMKKDQWLTLSEEYRDLYDNECLVLCLFIIKNYGKEELIKIIENGRNKLDYDKVDIVLKPYMFDLVYKITTGKNLGD